MRRHTERERDQPTSLWSGAIDALKAQIVVVDDAGVIVAVNRAWRSFAEAQGLPSSAWGVGAPYLTPCEKAAAGGDRIAARAVQGLSAVLAGTLASFDLEYPCRTAKALLWFRLTATHFACGESRYAVVVHEDVTECTLARPAIAAGAQIELSDENTDAAEHIPVLLGRYQSLTQRERQVAALLAKGLSSRQIAAELRTSMRTIDHHRARVLKKMAASNAASLARKLTLLRLHAPEPFNVTRTP